MMAGPGIRTDHRVRQYRFHTQGHSLRQVVVELGIAVGVRRTALGTPGTASGGPAEPQEVGGSAAAPLEEEGTADARPLSWNPHMMVAAESRNQLRGLKMEARGCASTAGLGDGWG
jgi:hypothetical protein